MATEKSSGEEKRRHPRIRIELPVQARVNDVHSVVLQLVDMSAQGMQLKVRSSDLEALRHGSEESDQNNHFEIQLTARLAWVTPEEDGAFKTGWEFNLLDDEERIG